MIQIRLTIRNSDGHHRLSRWLASFIFSHDYWIHWLTSSQARSRAARCCHGAAGIPRPQTPTSSPQTRQRSASRFWECQIEYSKPIGARADSSPIASYRGILWPGPKEIFFTWVIHRTVSTNPGGLFPAYASLVGNIFPFMGRTVNPPFVTSELHTWRRLYNVASLRLGITGVSLIRWPPGLFSGSKKIDGWRSRWYSRETGFPSAAVDFQVASMLPIATFCMLISWPVIVLGILESRNAVKANEVTVLNQVKDVAQGYLHYEYKRKSPTSL